MEKYLEIAKRIENDEMDAEMKRDIHELVETGSFEGAFAKLKGITPYKTAFLFRKGLVAKIKKHMKNTGMDTEIEFIIQGMDDKSMINTLGYLLNEGITNLSQLADKTKDDLLNIKGLGAKKVESIVNLAAQYGIKLK